LNHGNTKENVGGEEEGKAGREVTRKSGGQRGKKKEGEVKGEEKEGIVSHM
jgi:hypothetical protein